MTEDQNKAEEGPEGRPSDAVLSFWAVVACLVLLLQGSILAMTIAALIVGLWIVSIGAPMRK